MRQTLPPNRAAAPPQRLHTPRAWVINCVRVCTSTARLRTTATSAGAASPRCWIPYNNRGSSRPTRRARYSASARRLARCRCSMSSGGLAKLTAGMRWISHPAVRSHPVNPVHPCPKPHVPRRNPLTWMNRNRIGPTPPPSPRERRKFSQASPGPFVVRAPEYCLSGHITLSVHRAGFSQRERVSGPWSAASSTRDESHALHPR